VIAEPAPTTRLRRPSDAVRLVVALTVLVIVVGTASFLPDGTRGLNHDVAGGLEHLAHALVVVVDTVATLGMIALTLAYVVLLIVKARADAVNAVLGAGLAGLVMGVLVTVLNGTAVGLAVALLGHTDGSTMAVNTVIVATLTGGDIGHRRRWFNRAAGGMVVLIIAELALGTITPVAAIFIPLAGWCFGLAARLILGASSRRFSAYEVRQTLESLGFDVGRIDELPDREQTFTVTLGDDTPLVVRAVGPDVQAIGLAWRLWNMVRLRSEVTGRLPLTTRGRMEHEALAGYLAASAGIPAGEVVLFTEADDGVVVLARRVIDGEPLITDDSTDEQMAEAFATLKRLHGVGVAHRRLGPDQVLLVGGHVAFRDYSNADVAAAETVRRVDVAQLLVAFAEPLGAKRAVAAMRIAYGTVDDQMLAATLQPLALAPLGRPAMQQARPILGELRTELIGEPQLTGQDDFRYTRFRARSVFSAVALTFAAYLLIGQFSSINLVQTLSHVTGWWLAVAVIASAVTYFAAAINLDAFTPVSLFLPTTAAVELATAFVGLVTPPSVGNVTVNLRYLGKKGMDAATAGGCIAVAQLVSVVTTVVLLVVLGLLSGTGTHLKVLPKPRVLAVLGAAVVVIGILAAIPAVRKRVVDLVWPRIQAAWPRLLGVVSQPKRMIAGVGGNVLLTVSYVVALVACLQAVGAHTPILATAVAYLAGNSVGSIAPTPGGIGAVEAVMVASLTGIGIPGHLAVPGVLLFRIATFWLPILPGWLSFTLLQRRNLL